jgi:dTMP kinase
VGVQTFENLVAIEGGDGSGKRTQAELLREYQSSVLGINVVKMSFPRYGQPSAYYAGTYLDGGYGEANDVHPDLASLSYALDRWAASADLRTHLEQPNSAGVLDRWVSSNLAHQGSKISDPTKRKEFYDRILQLEYEIYQVPKPKINIVLLMPTLLAQLNVDKKDAATRSYTTKMRDVHEADISHLERAKANYEELCQLYPDEFTPVQCVDTNGTMRTISDIQQEIRNILTI